ncbi:MAG: hypothetical protein HN684_05115 [Euryarchaeota archaeon]|jgi:hypothetical protein|nr:hypothetical protein [Euryarchaeota archaeon]
MEISISVEELRKRRIFVATPMYGGQCAGMYTKSTADLALLSAKYGVEIKFFYLFNESLITRARNYLVDEFLRSGFDYLMFIDSDIGFDPSDVLSLAALIDPDNDKEIICGPYPKKTIAWEKIKMAVDRGFADKDPTDLNKYVGDFVFNPAQQTDSIPVDVPVEVLEGGTGFMMIHRSALVKYAAAYPEFSYRPDHVRTGAFNGTREITAFFDCVIDDKNTDLHRKLRVLAESGGATAEQLVELIDYTDSEGYSKRYLSEDYMFCQWSRKIGIKVWLCPWMKLAHVGNYTFGGSLPDLAAIGAGATVDVDTAKKIADPVVAPPARRKSKKK